MKWIIVTGDSRGVGREIAYQILNETDFGVIGISRTSEESADELLVKYPDRFRALSYDLANVEGVKQLYRDKIHKIGPIYGLVNNSAMAYDDIISNLNIDELETMFQVNVFSAMHLSKYAIRDMILHKTQGSIVHISSISAHTGYKGLSMYAATKGAMEAFSKNTAREWGSKGIRSNCVVPGFMETSISSTLTDEQKKRIYQRTSLKKETGIASVASTVLFLLSDKAKSITGTVVHVDNGTI
ncbi:SDR family NAD(P)-dependent oxidoreductase [Psychrobacillus psychrodurans]|uniref:SDR family NAD(P)-dependent oxidoreductase n=1 Tax=Psychrobacillus psychrodurans TaxID=126157 RepID=UPI0008E892A1|nr:SDR family oxidoreductase [Psychrobacillus psychrodurans]MCZ8539214.1 SDR family oxidoreductase [Psychrobacillus psychrodurans]SFM34147.1 3-oxoacyl-[acyl-carrier protein] reductase [Psychrobacillus psychrodurans]